jgi:sugar lactone lactonase YvrE/flagellar basal body-associated protein FliL
VVVEGGAAENKRGRTLLATLIILFILLLLAATAWLLNLLVPRSDADTKTAGIEWVRSVYAFGPNTEHLISPASVSTGGSDSFWVADQSNFRLVEFDYNGSYESLFSEDSSGTSHGFPSDIAVARNGDFCIVESTYHRLRVYNRDHELLWEQEVSNPMAVDVNDEMVVVGARSGFVAFDRQGKLIGYVGNHGTADDRFDTINGIVLDADSNVYVVDTYNNRLSKYDRAGDRSWIIGLGMPSNQGADTRGRNLSLEASSYPAAMQLPMGAALDSAGRILIIDNLDFSIAAFDTKDGRFIDKWGTFGPADGQLAYPSDISYDRGRDLFVVTDTGNQRAQIIRLPGSGGGQLSRLRSGLSGPLGACCVPLIIIVLALAAYALWRFLKRRRERERAAAEEQQAREQVEQAEPAPPSSAE